MTSVPADPTESQRNLAVEIPQASRRARAYKLTDDGASDLARRKRAAKGRVDSPEKRRRAIETIERRQAGLTNAQPLPDHVAKRWIAGHEKAIRAMESGSIAIGPAVPVIAPMTRRVTREDRKRERRARKDPPLR